MLRELITLVLVFTIVMGPYAQAAGTQAYGGRFSEEQLANLGKELITAQERLELLNVLMQSDFDTKWLQEDFESVTSKGHYDLSLRARLGPDSIYSGNPKLKYQYLVARTALDRAIDGLATWVMVDKEKQGNLLSVLDTNVKTTGPVYAAWLGQNVEALNSREIISQRYPGLTKKIVSLAQVIRKADPQTHLQLMAESLILPSVQLVATKDGMARLEGTRVEKEALMTSAARMYDIQFKTKKEPLLKVFRAKLEEVKKENSCSRMLPEDTARTITEEETKPLLSVSQVTRFDQESLSFEIAKILPCIANPNTHAGITYLTTIRDIHLPKINAEIHSARLAYERAREDIQKINEEMVQLHVTYNQLLYTEPYFTVLLSVVSRGSEFTNELLFERVAKDYNDLIKLTGNTRKQKLQAMLSYIVAALKQEQPRAVARNLEYIATVISGDAGALAPLVEVRQQTLQAITDWKPELVETFKEQDALFKADYGFDLEFEKFAELTYFEAYQLLAISLLTGQSKIASMRAMTAVAAFAHYKEEKLKNIDLLEAEKKKVFAELETLEKNEANKVRRANLKSQIWKIERQVLSASRSRVWGLGVLAPAAPAWIGAMAIDSALVGYNYYKNKEYRLFARKMIVNASTVGAISYAANVHSKNFSDKDLLYNVAIQAATAFTFTAFSFFRGNNAGMMIHGFIHPKGSTTINMLVSAMGRTTLNGLKAVARSPITITKGIGSLWHNFRTKGLAEFLGDKVTRPLINVAGTVLVATVVEMGLRGYNNPVEMFAEEEVFRLNLYSFAIIDFILSYVSEGNNATRAGMINFFVGVIGLSLAQYMTTGEGYEDLDVQRLLFEGAYIATYSTAKYKLFFKKSVIYFDNYWGAMFSHLAKAGNRQTARKLTSAAKFMINVGVFSTASNLAGNWPFLYVVRDLEKFPEEPEGRERFYAQKAYDYILQIEKSNAGERYSPADLEEYLNYIRQINESLKNDIDSIKEVS